MIQFKLLYPTNLGAALKIVQQNRAWRISGYIHSVLCATRKYHFFYLIQNPVKASIIASTVQCHTKLIFKFTQQIHTQNVLGLGYGLINNKTVVLSKLVEHGIYIFMHQNG